MKVVINALQYKQNSSGIGVMIRELFGSYTRITSRHCQVVLPADSPDFPTGLSAAVVRAPCAYSKGLRRMLFQTFRLGYRHCKNAVLLTTDSKIPLLIPPSCTVIPLVTDLAVYRLKETYQISRVIWWRMQYRYMYRRANLFLAVSQFTKGEMVKILHIPAEKIEVVPCACSSDLWPITDETIRKRLIEKYQLPEHFVLYVGNFNPRKNLERLIQAFDIAKEKGIPHQLVIAGEQGWKFDKDKTLRGITHRKSIRFIGYVPDADMPALYSAADLFAFPTLYEGFGIPVIEAQSCGTPILTSNCSSLPEVGGDAAVYVDPYDVSGIAEEMLYILNNPQFAEKLTKKGLENAKRFSWEASARQLDSIIERVVNE